MRVLQKRQASKCRFRNKNRAMNKILLARLKKNIFVRVGAAQSGDLRIPYH